MKITKGSYNQKSFLSLKGLDEPLPTTLNTDGNNEYVGKGSGFASKTSISQMRLENLSKGKNWEVLETFGLEELRDGFFDAAFTANERIVQTDPVDEVRKQNTWFGFESFYSVMRKSSKAKIIIFKYMVAYIAAICLCLVKPVGSWIGGKHQYILPVSVLIHHPVRSVGVQLQMSIHSFLGTVLGLGWSALWWYIASATNIAVRHHGGILFVGLILAIYFSSWFGSTFIMFTYLTLSFSLTVIILSTANVILSTGDLEWTLFRDFGFSYVCGIILSLFFCIVIDPHSGQSEVITTFCSTLEDIKKLLVNIVDKDGCTDTVSLQKLQDDLVYSVDMKLSEGYREFANQISINKFSGTLLRQLRNRLTTAVSPLRAIPLDHQLLTKFDLERLYELREQKRCSGTNTYLPSPSHNLSSATPQQPGILKQDVQFTSAGFYVHFIKATFSKEIFDLILELIIVIDSLQNALQEFHKAYVSQDAIAEIEQNLMKHMSRLKHKIAKLDIRYNAFTTSSGLYNDLLNHPARVDMFIFLRYIRQCAYHMKWVVETAIDMSKNQRWRIHFPTYPWSRAIYRLPRECALDQGAGSTLTYFETKREVDNAFEQIYNTYTSTRSNLFASTEAKNAKRITRAIDHNDFNFHTTENRLRYNIWLFCTLLRNSQSKWALKNAFIVVFLCLPAWLPDSSQWYKEYRCWWAPITFYLFSNSKSTNTWFSLLSCLGFGLSGIFWALLTVPVQQYGRPYLIGGLSAVICLICAINALVLQNRKSSLVGLLSFTVVALMPYSKYEHTSERLILKNIWIVGCALAVGTTCSVVINWIFWSVTARLELRASISSLLAHLSQSYQVVSDRYLYRDSNDDPTETTLKYASIREIRLSQSILAVKGLLKHAKRAPIYIVNFKPHLYEELLDHCKVLLEKMIEARRASQYFHVWDNDEDTETTRALLSLRRDSVASVAFVFYILSNCFRSNTMIPTYLPNPIYTRKKLFDVISLIKEKPISQGTDPQASPEVPRSPDYPDNSNTDNVPWTEVYAIAFTRTFTDFIVELERVVVLSKEILGVGPY